MQSHIYELGLLHGQCSDIRIRAFGRIYHFHRLLLIQSGFFRAMLCGGYAEDLAVSSAAARGSPMGVDTSSNRRSPSDADIVELRFDDPNISRAAFEYCMARLYGAGPKLVLPTWSSPYDTESLTPTGIASSDVLNVPSSDANSHPATPRFLLSLLATSVYLNIPSITSQALTLVLCSVTPYTITHYLRFAMGQGIQGTNLHRSADPTSHASAEWDWELDGPIRTLEHLARPFLHTSRYSAEPLSRVSSSSSTSTSQHAHRKRSTFDGIDASFSSKVDLPSSDDSHPSASQKVYRQKGIGRSDLFVDPLDAHLARERDSSLSQSISNLPSRDDIKTPGFAESLRQLSLEENVPSLPEYHYGSAADKIGEACVCWYAQKGYDNFFTMENALETDRIHDLESWIRSTREQQNLELLLLIRAHLHSGDADVLQTSTLPRERLPNPSECLPRPRIKVWAYPSLPSSWVRNIISSDSFFVRTEWERYEFAKRIVEFRRKQKKMIRIFDELIEGFLHELAQARSGDSLSASTDQECGDSRTMNDDGHTLGTFGIKAFQGRSHTSAESEDGNAQLSHDWNEESCSSHGHDEDEAEYEELFTSGIYYSHMSFQELNRISREISPITGQPYAPLHVLQAALWVSNELRNHVLSSVRLDPQANNGDGGWDHEADGGPRNLPEPGLDNDVSGELGVSSALSDFQQAFESHVASSVSTQRHERSRTGTPLGVAEIAVPDSERQPSLGLGGIGESPLLFGGSGGKAGLLKKRYYLVTSDDTVRFGDGLMSVIGINTSPHPATRRAHEGSQAGSPEDKALNDLGPTGHATAQIPHTIPIETLNYRDCGLSNNPKKHRDHYYGIANDVATGRELGESAHRASKLDLGNSRYNSPPLSRSPPLSTRGLIPDDPAESGDAGSATSVSGPSERWSAFEPMRIGVEFFGIDKLSEKQRLYSPTFFYAGSIWNLYIQLVRKTKGVQLGIYLHRQSPNETLPPPSAPTASDGDVVSPPHQSSTSPSQRRRADFMSPVTPRRAARMEQATTPESRAGADDAAAQHLRTGTQRLRSSIQDLDVNGGDGGAASSFFDTGLTAESPVRGAARQTQAGPPNGGRIGSSISLPGGQMITSLLGSTSSALLNDDPDATAATAPYSSSSDDATQTMPAASSSTSLFAGLASNFLRSGPLLPGSASNASLSDSQYQPTVPLFPGGPSVLQSCTPPAMPYKDPRVELRAYFSIHCPSPLGNALTKFSSGPDRFTNSQSWGWKSSSLLGAVYLENGDLEKGGKSGFWPRFRCVCTIGLV